jgi:lipopolysaccharide/colanic/teichoic acid biosynthesis glycosyltransferase
MSVISQENKWRKNSTPALSVKEFAMNQSTKLIKYMRKQNLPNHIQLSHYQKIRHRDMHHSPIRVVHHKSAFFQNHYQVTKRWFDLGVCLLLLPFVLPLLVLITAGIFLSDRQNPFFTQTRTGKGSKPFVMYKFRTMVPNAEAMLSQLWHLNETTAPSFKMKNDPRVTRIGHFLRKSSLDELPQIFNILKGDMSLVGPRPSSFLPETYKAMWHHERLEVTPGLTGLWAVEGRSELTFEEWVLLDIAYIEQQSLLFDITILWRTIESVLNHKGAY